MGELVLLIMFLEETYNNSDYDITKRIEARKLLEKYLSGETIVSAILGEKNQC